MILTLHRRYPDGNSWEIDPSPIGTITIDRSSIELEMDDSPIKIQIEKILSKPITYIDGLFSEDGEPTILKTVNQESEDYIEALISELKRFNIEARKNIPAMV